MQLLAVHIDEPPQGVEPIDNTDPRAIDIDTLQAVIEEAAENGEASTTASGQDRQSIENLIDELEEDGYFEEANHMYVSYQEQIIEVQVELLDPSSYREA